MRMSNVWDLSLKMIQVSNDVWRWLNQPISLAMPRNWWFWLKDALNPLVDKTSAAYILRQASNTKTLTFTPIGLVFGSLIITVLTILLVKIVKEILL